MNDIERIKADGLDVDIQKYVSMGCTSFLGVRVKNAFPIHTAIAKDDLVRLKWLGIINNNIDPSRFMLRVRVPNGRLKEQQLEVVADIARKFGNGIIDITTRQGIQIRGIDFYYITRILEDLEAVGLTTLQTGMDNVRNIVGCPTAGLEQGELIDASYIVQELTSRIVGNKAYINLPRKLNISITGCSADCANSAVNDIALTPAVKEIGDEEIIGFNLKVGGALGSNPSKLSTSLDVFLKPEEVVETCLGIVEIFRDNGDRETRIKARLKFLLENWGVEKFREELQKRLGKTLERAVPEPAVKEHAHIGIHSQKQEGLSYAGLLVPVGRLRAAQAMELSRIAEKYGSGELRLTHQQNVIIPNIPNAKLEEFKKEALLQELLLEPPPLMRNLVVCTGNDYCTFAQVESKDRALELTRRLEERLPIDEPLRIHFSGCPNSCGQHQVADIGLQGAKVRINGRLTEVVSIFLGGKLGKDACLGEQVMEKVPWPRAMELIEEVVKAYLEGRRKGESFSEFAKRYSLPQELLQLNKGF